MSWPRLPRRTIRLRLTALFGCLFLLCSVLLLGITNGIGSTSRAAVSPAHPSEHGGTRPQGAGAGALVTHQFFVGSAIAFCVVAVLAVGLAWVVAGRALRPLREMTAATRRISAESLDERLAVTGPDDELKDLADTIDELLGRLEHAFAAQRRFVANASHELRTPLATMRASLDVAQAKPGGVPPQTLALAGRLRAELDRVDGLLDGFLELARAQHGVLPGASRLALGEVVAAALAAVAGSAEASELAVRTEGLDTGLAVQASPALLARMAGNVLDNAVRHNQQGGWIAVTVRPGEGTACLVVENGGPVLGQRQVARLAEPFTRLAGERIGSEDGTGLGLSIVAAIAQAHGGTLDLTARPQGGLAVRIELPLATAPVRPEAAGAPA